MIRTVFAAIFAATLLFSLNAQAQQPDMSGTWHIKAKHADAKGPFLSIWTYGQVIASRDYHKTTFQLSKVGESNNVSLYHMKQHNGWYLSLRNGKVIGTKEKPSKDSARWIVSKSSKGYSITSFDDGSRGANALGFDSKDFGKTIEGPNVSGRYLLSLARNNSGGRGNSHQLWDFHPKQDDSDVRKNPANNGMNKNFVKDGALVEIYNRTDGKQKADGQWVLIKTGSNKQGDEYRIMKADGSVYLSVTKDNKIEMAGPVITVSGGGVRKRDTSKISTWTLHLNSKGWSIMLTKNQALAVSRNRNSKDLPIAAKTSLQRNQGYGSQLWFIRQIGMVINPEL